MHSLVEGCDDPVSDSSKNQNPNLILPLLLFPAGPRVLANHPTRYILDSEKYNEPRNETSAPRYKAQRGGGNLISFD